MTKADRKTPHYKDNVVSFPAPSSRDRFAQLIESESRLRLACAAVKLGVWDRNLINDKEFWSPEYLELYGLTTSHGDSSYQHWLDLIHPEDRKLAHEQASQAIKTNSRYSLEFRIVHPTKGLRWIQEIGHPCSADAEPTSAPTRFIGIAIDVTDRKQTEEILDCQHKASHILSRADNLPHAIAQILTLLCKLADARLAQCWTFDTTSSSFRACGLAQPVLCEELIKYSKQMKQLCLATQSGLPGLVQSRGGFVTANLQGLEDPRAESFAKAKLMSAIAFPITSDNKFLGVIELFDPNVSPLTPLMTEMLGTIANEIGQYVLRKEAEDAIRRHLDHLEELVRERTVELRESNERVLLTERLATIGTLSAGLGHDMGNLMIPLRSRINALEKKITKSDFDLQSVKADLEAVHKVTEYFDNLSKGLRQLSLNPRDPSLTAEGTDLDLWWNEVAALFRNVLPRNVELIRDFEAGLPIVAIARHRLTQVVFNLIQNAGDLLASVEHGRVAVSAAHHLGSKHVTLSISDNGPGMTEQVRKNCLDPFFSTRKTKNSTGLGLALVRSILESVEGIIDIASAPGEGTTFSLRLGTLHENKTAQAEKMRIFKNIKNPRLDAYISAVIGDMGIESSSNSLECSCILSDADPETLEAFINSHPSNRAIHFSDDKTTNRHSRIKNLGLKPTLSELKASLKDCTASNCNLRERM